MLNNYPKNFINKHIKNRIFHLKNRVQGATSGSWLYAFNSHCRFILRTSAYDPPFLLQPLLGGGESYGVT